MAHVLVAHRSPAVAGRMATALRDAGHAVESCAGPELVACPLLQCLPCPKVDRADVLVYDAWVAGDSDGGRRLISELRDIYVDLPVILTSASESLEWVTQEGPNRVTAFHGIPSDQLLLDAVERALSEQGMAV